MALVVMCGRPCSGKTRRAEELEAYVKEEAPEMDVVVLNEERLGLSREAYETSGSEKMHRQEFEAAVERALGSGTVVICDTLNYIKGVRYQLYCAAKALALPSCVVWTDADDDAAAEWNDAAADGSPRYPPDVFDDLWSRFEAPDARKRWDKPLFVVRPDDPLPAAPIAAYILHNAAPVVPNASTQNAPAPSSSFVSQLDAHTRTIVNAVIAWSSRGGMPGEPIVVDDPSSPGSTLSLVLAVPVVAAQLRRARKQYLKAVQLTPPEPGHIGATFVDFLSAALNP